MNASSPATASALRLAIVTNIPAPYRVPVYNRIAAEPGITLRVFYAALSEPDRAWDLPAFAHDHVVLKGHMHVRGGRYIHDNHDVWGELARYAPDVVLTTGYNPTHLYAWLYALLHGKRHVVMTDGTDVSEAGLGRVHRLVRKLVMANSQAYVAASAGGWRLLRSYGVPDARIHFSPLCANTSVDWSAAAGGARDIDMLFSGRLVAVKNAGFALQVAQGVAQRLGRRIRLGVLGSGPLEAELRQIAAQQAPSVDVTWAGHVSQADVPSWFQRARLFLFPTLWDPWGVVANEACLAGVPVLVTPHAGAAGELVRDGVNGRVLPLDLTAWVEAAQQLLSDPALHARLSGAARLCVGPYNFDNAAAGIVDAVRQSQAGSGRSGAVTQTSRFGRPAGLPTAEMGTHSGRATDNAADG